jgi:predicted metal-dependent RNase
MLMGGASVEYLKHLAENPKNLMILSSYQGPGSLGRKIQEGEKVVDIDGVSVKVQMKAILMSGLSPHSSRNELMQYISRMNPKPKRIVINHGEVSKCIDLASSLYRANRVETLVPRNLETIRLK